MCFYLPLQKFSLEYRSEIKLWDKKIHIINQKTCHLHHKFSSNFTHMPYNALNTKDVYKGGKLPPLLLVTSEKIVMKDELEVYIKIQKNLPNYSIMENPLTKKMEDYQKHKKQKSCKSCDLQDSVAEREALRAISPKVIKHAQTSILRAFVFFSGND